jgi:hypothetical protein
MPKSANQNVLVILRHENSLQVVRDYFSENNLAAPITIALDRIALKDQASETLAAIIALCQIPGALQAIIVGTKVYDDTVDDARNFPDFLTFLKQAALPDTVPVIATHLDRYTADEEKALLAMPGIKLTLIQNDNLARDGMGNLGPVLLNVLKHRHAEGGRAKLRISSF